ncbi:MAG: AGE family epimerase/isomerase [Pseudomonadota bacterium]
MAKIIHPVILCGGAGTRLWPLSTPETPKQFLRLVSDRSMIEDTAARFTDSAEPGLSFGQLLVVGALRHRALLSRALPDAKQILEPFGRNSAPAVAAACLAYAPEDLILILPADHDIRNVPAFHRAITVAAGAASAGAIITFGIEPTHPATGYGYIKAAGQHDSGVLSADQFVEKPDLETAKAYLAAGSYYWNAGIFLFKAGVMLNAMETFAPEALAGVKKAMGTARGDIVALVPEAFEATPSISIDYAVMEKADNVKTVPVSMGWSDVGGYRALHELMTDHADANYVSGPVHVQNSNGLYVRSEGPTISINGVSNLVIVATGNEVMITPKDDDGAVKALGAAVRNERHSLRFSPELKQTAKSWLWEAFDTWSTVGWDEEHGGFVEQLHMDGTPDAKAARRVRVQARQVFCFSKAIEMGYPNRHAAEDLVKKGLAYIDSQLRHPESGFVHMVAPDGTRVKSQRDLYDHAFIILAGSAAHKATGSELALEIARDTIAFIDAKMKCETYGGWVESLPIATPRRTNPHMHLLEAMLEFFAATGDETALDRAREIVTLFECRFFNPANDVMAETFAKDWQLTSAASETIFEPGHHYEWASLLYMFENVSGHDTLSWRRRLIRRADASAINTNNGFPYNSVKANGEITNASSRVWHSLERFRAYLLHPDLASSRRSEQVFEQIKLTYLSRAPNGGWIDEVGHQGEAVSKAIPASMLYHFTTAFAPLIATS